MDLPTVIAGTPRSPGLPGSPFTEEPGRILQYGNPLPSVPVLAGAEK